MYGMSSKEFWDDDPQLYWSYRTFYLKKLEEEELKTDYTCWLTGLYTYSAISEIVGGMFDKDPNNVHTYIEKPMSMLRKENEKKENIDPNIRQQMEFNMWARY